MGLCDRCCVPCMRPPRGERVPCHGTLTPFRLPTAAAGGDLEEKSRKDSVSTAVSTASRTNSSISSSASASPLDGNLPLGDASSSAAPNAEPGVTVLDDHAASHRLFVGLAVFGGVLSGLWFPAMQVAQVSHDDRVCARGGWVSRKEDGLITSYRPFVGSIICSVLFG